MFDAAAESMCTSSTMYTLRRLDAPTPRCTLWMSSRIASTPLFDAASSSTRSKNVPVGDRDAVLALAARLAVGAEIEAVERTREEARGRGLAGAARAGEEVRVTDAIFGDRVAQRGGDVVLADELREALRAVLPVQAGHGPTVPAANRAIAVPCRVCRGGPPAARPGNPAAPRSVR